MDPDLAHPMAQMTDVVDWTLLGGELVPGDVEAVRELADRYGAAARLATACREGATAHGGAAASSGWSGATATAYREVIGVFASEVAPLESAADRAASALDGFAEVLASLQTTAADLLEIAQEADAQRSTAEATLQSLDRELAEAREALALARQRWEVTQGQADAAEATLDPAAGELQVRAGHLRIALNDAVERLAVVEAEITATERGLADANATLASARAEASRLREELRTSAVTAAVDLEPVLPYGQDLIIAASMTTAAPAGASSPSSSAAPAAQRPHPLTRPPAGIDRAPTTPSSAGLSDTAMTPTTAMSTAAVRSILAAVRLRGGTPVPVAKVQPKLEVFRTYQRLGLQDVTARGAAIARALGFEGVIGGLGTRPYRSDHSMGLALDLMTYDDVATGEALAAFYVENHADLGVTYVIWNGQIASPRDDWAWRPYRHPMGRTDRTAMHLDHVHVSFDPDDNAYACACFGVTS